LRYKNYIAVIYFDEEKKIFRGSVVNTSDAINFAGSSVDELQNEFERSIKEYLELCKEAGKTPQKPYSGIFTVRISPELHQKISIHAQKNNISINKAVIQALAKEYMKN
jgi:predicted HicB family RNase H-like nuclease